MNGFEIAKEQLKIDEGFSGRVYQCTAGKNTIGYGRNLDSNPLTRSEADHLLDNDLKQVVKECLKLKYYANLNPKRRAVILNMVYNMGTPAFLNFEHLNAALIAHDYEKAAIEMIASKWARQVPTRALALSDIMKNA